MPDSCFCFILFINNKTQLLKIRNNKPLIKPDNKKTQTGFIKIIRGYVFFGDDVEKQITISKNLPFCDLAVTKKPINATSTNTRKLISGLKCLNV